MQKLKFIPLIALLLFVTKSVVNRYPVYHEVLQKSTLGKWITKNEEKAGEKPKLFSFLLITYTK